MTARLTRATLSALLCTLVHLASPQTVAAQACRPVPGNNLEKFYPVMPGWMRGMPQSETDLAESVSRTTVDFDRKTETISVELMDSCRRAEVLQLARQVLKALPPATRGTTQRHTTVNGFPAYEEFTAEPWRDSRPRRRPLHGQGHRRVIDSANAAECRTARADGGVVGAQIVIR